MYKSLATPRTWTPSHQLLSFSIIEDKFPSDRLVSRLHHGRPTNSSLSKALGWQLHVPIWYLPRSTQCLVERDQRSDAMESTLLGCLDTPDQGHFFWIAKHCVKHSRTARKCTMSRLKPKERMSKIRAIKSVTMDEISDPNDRQ